LSQVNRRDALKLAALGAVGALSPALVGCNRPASTASPVAGPIKIGLLAPQTGKYKAIGDDLTNGFKLYLNLRANKLAGHPVTLVLADEGETAESGRAAADTLLKTDSMVALTGVANPAVITVIKDAVEGAQIPLVGSNASPTSLLGVKYIWRTSYVGDEPGRSLGKYVTQATGTGPVYVISTDNAGGREEVKGFLDTFTGKLLGPTYTPASQTNFLQYFTQIRTQGAKAVFCHFAEAQAVAFVKQYLESGLKLPLYAPGFLTEGAVLKAEGESARGVFTAMNYSPDLDNPTNRTFTSEYTKLHNASPTAYAMASYDAAAVLDKALDLLSGNPTPQSLNVMLGRIGSVTSPRGTWQFNQNRTPQQKWYLRQVRADGTGIFNSIVTELGTLG
jgi:branched-chain amino acid transport system substrate-binding protein